MLFVDLPLMLAGPLLRRVEPNLVSIWVALEEWLASGPDPTVQILPFSQQLHGDVVTSELSVDKTLQPDRNRCRCFPFRRADELAGTSRTAPAAGRTICKTVRVWPGVHYKIG